MTVLFNHRLYDMIYYRGFTRTLSMCYSHKKKEHLLSKGLFSANTPHIFTGLQPTWLLHAPAYVHQAQVSTLPVMHFNNNSKYS